jgi:hypothetical protein
MNLAEQLESLKARGFDQEWGFRTMPISVPSMPITDSGLMAITIPG